MLETLVERLPLLTFEATAETLSIKLLTLRFDRTSGMSTQANTTYSEPSWSKVKNTDVPWWRDNIDKYLDRNMQDLLANYSKIPREEQSAHVHKIRDKVWAIRTYPCIGLGLHLQPYVRWSPVYSTILDKVKNGAIFLDMGCLLGSDLRQLAFEGAPSNNLIGIDVVSFWDLGKEMFRDPEFEGRFVECDVMKLDACSELLELKGKTDIINISAVLHQWDWGQQAAAVTQIIQLSKVGTMVVGYQIGNADSNERQMDAEFNSVKILKQSPETFARLWREAGESTGTIWETEASMRSFESIGWDTEDCAWLPPGDEVLDFVVTRIR